MIKLFVYLKNINDARKELRSHLLSGGIIIAPTDTVFGILCLDGDKIIKLKKKPAGTPVQLLASLNTVLGMIPSQTKNNASFANLTQKFWPGQLSIITTATSGKKECFRVPAEPFLLRLLEEVEKPICASSLNLHGNKELWSEKEVREFAEKTSEDIFVIFEDRKTSNSSTIISFEAQEDGGAKIEIIRQGEVEGQKVLSKNG